MIFVLLLITVLTLGYVYVKWRYTYWKRLGVPCTEPTFLVGNVGPSLFMTSHIALLCEKWYNDYPNVPYTGYYKILSPGINLRDPNLIKDVLVKDHFSFHVNEQDFSRRFDPLMAHNPFVDSWRKGRTVLTPLLTLFKVRQLHPLVLDSCEKLLNYLKTLPPTEDIETKSLVSRFATQNVIHCSFSIDSQCFTDKKTEFRDMGKKIFQPTLWGGIKLMLMSICPILRDVLPFAFLPFEVDRWFRDLIPDLKEQRKKTPLQQEDLFQMILNVSEKYEMNPTELAGYSLTLFVEGYETSSSVLAFAIYEMARNPDIQERLLEEINDVLAKYDGQFKFDALQEMEYLDNIVQEAMRLHVVAPLISRKCTKEYKLPKLDGQKEGVTIYPGTPVQICVRALQMCFFYFVKTKHKVNIEEYTMYKNKFGLRCILRDPNYYPDPEVFDPNRFTEEERKKRHKAIFMPFGEGPRMCTGIKFALAQTKAGLMTIVKDFKITLSPNHKRFVMDIRTFLYQARDGLLVNFTPRN